MKMNYIYVAQINAQISNILRMALAGYRDDYKYKDKKGNVYVRWGQVEKDIHKSVARILMEEPG